MRVIQVSWILLFRVFVQVANHLPALSFQLSGLEYKNKRGRHEWPPSSTSSLGLIPGADIEQPSADVDLPLSSPSSSSSSAIQDVMVDNTGQIRGKVNEIDFCIAPADVSLSRSYNLGNNLGNNNDNNTSEKKEENTTPPVEAGSASTMSLTRALNFASNRAVRRILLARSWPSAKALNESLRRVMAAKKEKEELMKEKEEQMKKYAENSNKANEENSSTITAAPEKCPVPRSVLNILMRRREYPQNSIAGSSDQQPGPRKSRTDEEYVADQLQTFRQKYGTLQGYSYAESYLESILSLATSGEESTRVSEVMESEIFDESYKRVTGVLKSAGAVFEELPGTNRYRIAAKLVDEDLCLAPFDKFNIPKNIGKQQQPPLPKVEDDPPIAAKNDPVKAEDEPSAEAKNDLVKVDNDDDVSLIATTKEESGWKFRFQFWKRKKKSNVDNNNNSDETNTMSEKAEEKVNAVIEEEQKEEKKEKEEKEEIKSTDDDLGAVLLNAKEPSMTRNLNALSNIVLRALLFGGDEELLVLYETLIADIPPFIERWYPGTGGVSADEAGLKNETRPGVQYANCLVRLLSDCYVNGYVDNLEPPLPLIQSYRNSYERLIGLLVEMGSGYIKPTSSNNAISAMPAPRTATEELGRFAVLETTFRRQIKSDSGLAAYPEDLEGSWEVRDQIGGKTIGVSTVNLLSQGQVEVAPPMEGLRWRLDPGPTHLDTCTFQVLGDDGTILQYRGFIDRGARLESRFSKRSIKIRGSVMFQMRDGDLAVAGEDYLKDMLPVNYKTGTTKFVMTKQIK